MTDQRGGLTRRDLLRLGFMAGPASIAAACGWDGGSLLEPKLRAFSRINDWVSEKVLLSGTRLAKEYPVTARTPPRHFPAYSITFNQTGSFPSVSHPADWSLDVGGLVRKPLRLLRKDIEALPSLTYTVKHYCVEGWTAIAT